MAFDIQGALKEGYSLPEIVDYLGGQKKFDVAGARSEGYSDQEILDFLSPKKKEEGIGTALRRGAEQLVSTGQTALESITKGGEEAAIRGRERQADIQARLGEGASLDRLLETYRQQGFLAAGKELAGQIPSAIAEQVPGIATTLAGAGAGAAAGSVVPGVGTVIGGLAGAVAPSLIQQYGGNIQRQAEAQAATGKPLQIERGTAAATAVPQAALDVAATFIPLGGRLASSVFGPKVGQMLMQSSAEGREKIFKESLLSTVLKGTAVGVAAEVPTEVVQTMLERAQADLPVLTDDALREYGEVAFATSLLGPIGIIGRVSNKAEAGRRLAEAQQKAIDTNELQQVEIQTEEKKEPTVLFVSPAGDVAQSLEQLDEINKIKQQQSIEQPTVTEATTTPEADQRAIQKRMVEGFRQQPAIQKIEADYQAAMAKVDASKVAQSAFNTLFNEDVIKSFGLGPTATLFKDQEILNADISNPETADLVRSKLEDFSKKTSSKKIKDSISNYLDRVEFLTPNAIDAILNPPQEIPAGAEDLQQFAFIDQNGKVKSVIGNIVKKGNKQYIKYPKGQRELTEDVVVNPNPDQIKLLKLYKDRDNELKSKDEFKEWLKLYGVNPSERQEIGLEKNFVSPYFRKSGYGADELVLAAINDGILSESDFDFEGSVGGVDSMREYIRRAMSNEFVPTPNNSIKEINLRRIDDRIAEIEDKLQGIPEEVVAEQAIQEQQAKEESLQIVSEAKDQEIGKGTYNIDPEEQKITKELKGKTFLEASQWTIDNAPNKFAKYIAEMVNKRLSEMANRGVKLNFQIYDGKQRPGSLYGSRGKTFTEIGKKGSDTTISIALNGAAVVDNQNGFPPGARYITVLHELLHGATVGQLALKKSDDPLVKQLQDLRNQVVDYFNNRVKEKNLTPFMERIYKNEINALADVDELISWGLTDKDMQEFLSEIKVGEKTVYNKLVELVRKILGIAKEYETALDRLITTSESILQEDIEVIADRLIARGYSFGEKQATKPFEGIQQTLFERAAREKVRAPLTGVDPAYADKLLKQFTAEKATVKQRFENLKENFFERMVIGVFDEFRTIKKYSDEAYMMARMSKSIDGGLQGLLEHGEVFNDGGALNIRPGTKGLLKILEPLGTEVDQYQMWKALNRDANLPADKRSFDPELLAGRDQLSKGQLNGKSRKDIYEKALKEEQALNRSVLKVALDAGIIDKAGYDRFASDIYYIPFYKAMEDGDVQSISASSKLTGQEFSKSLKGGEKKVNDLMENVLMNWSHILSAAMKNQAANKTLEAAEDMGVAKIAKPVDGKYPPNTVKVMRDGKPVRIEIEDVGLVDAISTISYLGPKSMFLDVAKHFTNALRYGVTLSPAYKLRNLIRDSISSAAVSPLSKNLYQNVYNGLKMSDKGNPTYMSALASGGIFEMGVAHEGNQAKLIKRLIDKGVDYGTILDSPEKVKGVLQSALDWYNTQGNRFENANRLALYDKLLKEGKTHLEASFQARDLMDFSMQGQFRAVKVLSSVVPFFNARLQGLYKLGRDGITPTYRLIYNTTTGKEVTASDKQKAQRFMTISGAVMLASMALYGMYKDDEEFKKREDWDRDNFWWFKIGDTKFRIPKPFEIGALGTMAERTLEQISDDKVEGKVFFNRLNHILMDTFALNPIPQMVKPMIDLYSNKDSFTGAPIVSAGMERLSAQERITNNTSGIAQALGGISAGMHKVLTFNPDAQGMSPVQIDYAIKAYLGWAGSTAVATADLAVEPFTEGTRVRKPVIDTVAMGFIKTEPETASKFMTEFYETNARVQSALADMRHYAELGDSEKVGKILRDQGDDIALAKLYDKTSKQLAEIRKQIRLIEQSKDIDTEDKRAEMNRLRILMSKMTENVEGMRKSLKQ